MTIRGEPGRCSHLYHYYLHPQFGWLYVRLQTWFPFEIQVYLNGREWLARQLDAAGLCYQRSDNKFLWVSDWQRAQELFDQQLQMNSPQLLDGLRLTERRGPVGGSSRRKIPGRSALKHRPLAQVRSRSTDSAAVTATGTTFCAACTSGKSSNAASR